MGKSRIVYKVHYNTTLGKTLVHTYRIKSAAERRKIYEMKKDPDFGKRGVREWYSVDKCLEKI